MPKANKRIISALTAAAVTLACTSCSYVRESHTEINTPVRISFAWWGNDERAAYTLAALDNYEETTDGITVVAYTGDFSGYKEKLDVLYSCGKESDVIQINYAWLSEYSPDGEGFYDLSKLSSYIDLENFSEEELSYGTVDGKLNALPVSLNAPTFYYNADLYEQYGLDIPETWDDFFECAKVFSENGICTLDTSKVYLWLMLIAHEEQVSGKASFVESGSLEFDTENIVSMMEYLKKLRDGNVVRYGNFDRNNFFNGESASVLLWASSAEYYVAPLEKKGTDVVVGNYPLVEGCTRSGWYVKPTSFYVISPNTEHPADSARLVNYLLNDPTVAKLQGIEKGVPLSSSALETLEANDMLSGVSYDAASKISDSTVLSLSPTKLEDVDRYEKFFSQFDLYYYGQATAEQAANNFLTAQAEQAE